MKNTEHMKPLELFEYRVNLIRDAQNFKKPDRISICGNLFTWMFLDAGYDPGVAGRDYNLIYKIMERTVTEYKLDEISFLSGGGFRNSFLVSDAVGGSNTYTTGDDGTIKMNAIVEDVMLPDEYSEVFTDEWCWKALIRKFPHVLEMTPEELANATRTLDDFYNAKFTSMKRFREEYGQLNEINTFHFMSGFEGLGSLLRGMKGISIDLRRCPEKVDEFVSWRNNIHIERLKKVIERTGDGPDMNDPFDISTGILQHTLLTRKQFDKYYADLDNKAFSLAAEHGKQIHVFAEGSWERFGDHYNDFPKGTLSMHVEQDDIYEIRKKYPNICLCGGIPTTVLGRGTKEECIDAVKMAIDELGRDGGLILMPNKMISYENDCKSENLKAICDFVTAYEI